MKRILLVLAILAGSVFMAAPATAADDTAPAPGDPVVETTDGGNKTDPPPATPPADSTDDSASSSSEQTTPAPAPDDSTSDSTGSSDSTDTTPDPGPVANLKAAPEIKAAAADDAVLAAAIVDQVTICHATSAETNPYTNPTVSVDSIFKPNGHGTHGGDGVWYPGAKGDGFNWGDIIPPFDYDGGSYPGLNWTADGQALLRNGCNEAGTTEEVTTEAPVVGDPTCSQDGTLVLPETEGVTYTVDPAFNGPGDYTVTAEADSGFVLSPGSITAFPVTVLAQLDADDPQCVIGNSDNVTICHATGAENNPYVVNSPNKQGVLNGHADQHTGQIWFPGAKDQGVDWGDIIPPFDYGNGQHFDGLNWTVQGQLIYNNGCIYVELPRIEQTNPSFVLLDPCTGDVVDTDTDGLTQIVPVAGDGGYTWEFTEGDGQTGAWTLVFSPKDGFDFGPDAVQEISGNAGSQADCEVPEGVLPDTGGSSPWILLMGVGLTVAGVLLLSARAALGLAGSGPVGAPSPTTRTWTQEVLTTRELTSHRGKRRRQGWAWILTGKRS